MKVPSMVKKSGFSCCYVTNNDFSGLMGIEFTAEYICEAFPAGVKNRLFDIEGTDELVRNIGSIDGTNFSKDTLFEMLTLEDDSKIEPWRIGEALAEYYLESHCGVRFHYNLLRDMKNPKANVQGADIVGFADLDGQTVFLVGEVKTSTQLSVPPNVLQGRSGMTHQIKEMILDQKKFGKILRYLGWKAIKLPDNDPFKIDYQKSFISYGDHNKVEFVGVLVRDTNSDARDLSNHYQNLLTSKKPNHSVRIFGFYIPFPTNHWEKIVRTGAG